MLSPEIKKFFTSLAVFRGGWTVEAAEEVCEEHRALDFLSELAECSLITAEHGPQGSRFTMLEIIRRFASEQLRESGADAVVRDRHLDYMVALAEKAHSGLDGAEQADWLHCLDLEHDNLLAAHSWCRSSDSRAVKDLRLTGRLVMYWLIRDLSLGRSMIAEALACAGAEGANPDRAQALNAAGILANYAGDMPAARSYFEEALAMGRRLGRRIQGTLHNLGSVVKVQGDLDTARSLFEEALALNRNLGNRLYEAKNLGALAGIACDQGDLERARALHVESVNIMREQAVPIDIGIALINLAVVGCHLGEFEISQAHFEEALTILRPLQDKRTIGFALCGLAYTNCMLLNYDVASRHLAEGLRCLQESHSKPDLLFGLERAAIVTCLKAEASLETMENRLLAARLQGAADALLQSIGYKPGYAKDWDEMVAALNQKLGEEAFQAAYKEGLNMRLEQAVTLAIQSLELPEAFQDRLRSLRT